MSNPFSGEELDVRGAIHTLPTLLDRSSLPDGVIELVIDDFDTPTRQMFDIHDCQVKLIEPGTAVPWASISGSPAAWASALGPECDFAQLTLTGDQHLAKRVLAAMPPPP